MKKHLLPLLLLITLFACNSSKSTHETPNLTIEKLSEKVPPWQNLKEYDEIVDYMKNLDFKVLESDSLGPHSRLIMELLWHAVEGEVDPLIEKLKAVSDTVTAEDKLGFYRYLLSQQLSNEGRYQEAVDLLGLSENHLISVLASFPDEEFSSISEPIDDRLRFSDFGHAVATVEINGDTLSMWLDTGADYTLLSVSKARKFGVIMPDGNDLSIGTVTSIEVQAGMGYIPELKIGNVSIRNHPVLIMDDKDLLVDLDSIQIDFSAIIGWSALRKMQVSLDEPNLKYETKLSQARAISAKNFFWFGYPALKLQTESGQSLAFGLDTGMEDSELKTNILTKADFPQIRTDSVGIGGVGGIEKQFLQIVDSVSLTLDGYRLKFKAMEVHINLDFPFIYQDGTLGIDLLKSNKLVIDYPNREFRINPEE
ncbi:MAG: clan AA aspartic protease [Roseivirga sp.]|nr:clan AA aspartic protease [Roseivirga sp.]